MPKPQASNSQKTTDFPPVIKIKNYKQDRHLALESDPETIAALTQIEARHDYYHTCINGGY
ncbi:hypothetical protein [Kamptonema sp. UHCC 0994]|uniref:hypothetical protein n=1 Tax=Kamptonema sp. UHCC 0994 TaxID=3031329 RepID=UPI0023B9544C|nr:hypothetical protein [Kamptonema sp. UHCC 0994]MDF0555646.1 hypothetical protein [Kamptonema sp. UHCC 0994]